MQKMKKRDILQKEQTFTEIINKCPYVKNTYYVIYYRKNHETTKFGISVPKKTGKANVRNKIKRRVKNIIDTNEKIVQKNFDYVIIIRKKLIELNYQEMEFNLINLLKKIGEKNERKK